MTTTDNERRGLLNRVIELSLGNRMLVAFAVVLACVLGVIGFRAMETDLFPDLSSPVITVFVENPGLAAQEGETLIARPLESAFRSLPNVVKVRSESEIGVVSVRTEFRFGTDYYLARQLLAERMASVARDFPAGTDPPVLSSAASRLGEVLLFYVAGEDGKVDTKELKETADYLIRYKLQTVPGVIRITSHGGDRRIYEVALNPERMRSYNVSHHDIVRALEESNLNFSGGFITGTATEMDVRGLGRINSLEDVANVVVVVRDGVPVRISDIAGVRDGSAVRRGIARVNEREAVVMTVTKQFGTDTLSIVEESKKALDELKPFMPEGVSTVPFFDQSELIKVATRTLEEALVVGGVAVVFIIFLFLGNGRSTLIAAVTIPVAVIISFIFLRLFGVTLNIMSLGGLAVGLGIMIDAAIVDTENIFRHLKKSPDDSLLATLRGASEVRRPAAYSTAIIIVVFLPLLFLSGLEGKILSPFALTVIVLMAVGLVLSLTLTPVLCYSLLRKVAPRLKEESWLASKCERVYEPLLRWSLGRPLRAVAAASGIFILSLVALPFLGTELLPRMDEGSLLVHMTTPAGTSLDETDRIATQVTKLLEGGPDVAAVIQPVGRAENSEDPMPVNSSEIYLQLVPRKQRQKSIPEIEEWVREQVKRVPGIASSITTPLNMRIDESISGTSAALAVKVFGSNLETLSQKGAEVKRIVETIPGVVDVRLESLEGVPQVVIDINRERASRYELNPGEIGHTVEALLGGREVTTVIKDQIKEYPVVIRLHEQYRDMPEKLATLMIDTATGHKIPLSDIADVRVQRGPAAIKREDQVRRIQVSMNVQGRDIGSVVKDINQRLAGLKLPEGYFISYGGGYERQQELAGELTGAFIISGLLVFLLLYLAFRSITQALLVIATIPLALAGGFIALWVTGTTLNVSSIIGLLAHFGLSVQKGLILVEYVNQMRAEGRSLRDALYLGAHTRMRPVLMTAASAGLGVLPIAIGWGAGAELQQPMAIALIGGLITSTILTLVALPALYELSEGLRDTISHTLEEWRNPGTGAKSSEPASAAD
ncbi:MAG TPA: efflux RND transporter permease subunit [Blastocatellia bacterium]|nr:efflux RND transporter permease subunit [Blastocatellia bacterium]